jgi:hypothetical protein
MKHFHVIRFEESLKMVFFLLNWRTIYKNLPMIVNHLTIVHRVSSLKYIYEMSPTHFKAITDSIYYYEIFVITSYGFYQEYVNNVNMINKINKEGIVQ